MKSTDRPVLQWLRAMPCCLSLPAGRRAFFGLHASGMSVRAIASKLGCSPAVVQNAIAQAQSSRPQIARRENRVAYELHRALATYLDERPDEVISKAMENVANMRSKKRDPFSSGWVSLWEQLLQGDLERLKESMLEISTDAENLRQMSPIAGVLSDGERLLAIKKAAKYASRITGNRNGTGDPRHCDEAPVNA